MLRQPLAGSYRVLLFGGSFNPPHAGHVFVAETIRKKYNFHAVWWLVNPSNPTKNPQAIRPLSERLTQVKNILPNQHHSVFSPENRYGTNYTYNILKRLRKAYPRNQFVWLMGADCLANFTSWKQWRKLLASQPMLIADRDPFSLYAHATPAGLRARKLGYPLLRLKKQAISSTQLRNQIPPPPHAW
jgi:nicotinate-nucleotide adenylyltransferase